MEPALLHRVLESSQGPYKATLSILFSILVSITCFSFKIVGQNIVFTKGTGVETVDVPESDWIVVQPDDRLGTWEAASYIKGEVKLVC